MRTESPNNLIKNLFKIRKNNFFVWLDHLMRARLTVFWWGSRSQRWPLPLPHALMSYRRVVMEDMVFSNWFRSSFCLLICWRIDSLGTWSWNPSFAKHKSWSCGEDWRSSKQSQNLKISFGTYWTWESNFEWWGSKISTKENENWTREMFFRETGWVLNLIYSHHHSLLVLWI